MESWRSNTCSYRLLLIALVAFGLATSEPNGTEDASRCLLVWHSCVPVGRADVCLGQGLHARGALARAGLLLAPPADAALPPSNAAVDGRLGAVTLFVPATLLVVIDGGDGARRRALRTGWMSEGCAIGGAVQLRGLQVVVVVVWW